MRRGLTILEIALILVILVVIVGVFVTPLFVRSGGRAYVRPMKDATMVKQLHQALVVFGHELQGPPLPSTVQAAVPGGEGERAFDTTANIYAQIVMQNYCGPELLVSPLEVQPHVTVKEDYDWDVYDPVNGVFWDPSFVMAVDDPGIGANGSYAHWTPVPGRNTIWTGGPLGRQPRRPVLALRGPAATTGAEHDRSPTLRFAEPHDAWIGSICFADNHVVMGAALGQANDTNIFTPGPGATDAALGIFSANDGVDPTRVFDPLDR